MTKLAEPWAEERGWRSLEFFRPGKHRVMWVCQHGPRRGLLPLLGAMTIARRQFAQGAVVRVLPWEDRG